MSTKFIIISFDKKKKYIKNNINFNKYKKAGIKNTCLYSFIISFLTLSAIPFIYLSTARFPTKDSGRTFNGISS